MYISILRGINLGNHNKIPMPQLKALYESIGFTDVITYIQSGNVLFNIKTKVSDKSIAQKIEATILKDLGLNVPVLIRTAKEMEAFQNTNPFLKQKDIDLTKTACNIPK